MAILAVGPQIPLSHAVETYTLTLSTGRIQETNTPGVTLTLNVSSAVVGTFYAFRWNVTDPAGNIKSQVNGALASSTVFVLSVVYPRDFSGAAVTYNGTYRVNISQLNPIAIPSVATGKFNVGITDNLVYRRTAQVSILAQGYAANENITIRISNMGTPATGFPKWQRADANGLLSFQWQQVPVSAPTGVYTVALTGSVTIKTVPDTQSFTVLQTSLTLSQLLVGQALLQRSQIVDLRFTASYPNGLIASTGSGTVRIVEPDGTTFHFITASYSASTNSFRGTYQIPLAGPVGAWVANIEVNSVDDGYGNVGPSISSVRGFAVAPATLTLIVLVANKTYASADLVTLYVKIITPGNYNFTTGTVLASISYQGRTVGSPLILFYDQAQGRWFASFAINATSPSGTWLIIVTASDPYGNAGQGNSGPLTVAIPQQSSTFNYLLVTLGILAVAIAVLLAWIFFFGKNRVLRKVLKVDIQAIDREAAKVENRDFFKQIREQVKQQKKPQEDTKNG
jgi:hypothetical protein